MQKAGKSWRLHAWSESFKSSEQIVLLTDYYVCDCFLLSTLMGCHGKKKFTRKKWLLAAVLSVWSWLHGPLMSLISSLLVTFRAQHSRSVEVAEDHTAPCHPYLITSSSIDNKLISLSSPLLLWLFAFNRLNWVYRHWNIHIFLIIVVRLTVSNFYGGLKLPKSKINTE